MAQFRATVKGSRGEASRLGHKSTGITARINGWESGITVYARHIGGHDCFIVCATGGSNGNREEVEIGYLQDGIFTQKIGARSPIGKKVRVWK